MFYGPGHIRSQGVVPRSRREVTIADVAPTLAGLLDTPWPKGRAGRPLLEVPVPERGSPPKLILTVVWDGGGTNVLDRWRKEWPYLARLMERGTSFDGAIVGSSPSVTPAIHATLGSGTFPNDHGIVDIQQRHGDRMAGSFEGRTALKMKTETLADMYDRAMDNLPLVGMFAYEFFHLGMMGHGAGVAGGDHDLLVTPQLRTEGFLEEPAVFMSNSNYYYMPTYIDDVPGFEDDIATVDAADGTRDNEWLGDVDLLDPNDIRHSPAWVLYQTRLLISMLEREGFGADDVPDLFFTNYKQIDSAGHAWNMLSDHVRDLVAYSDDALKELVRWLEGSVGRGNFVLVMTADHGQVPDPLVAGNDAWPIRISYLKADVARHFGVEVDELFMGQRPIGFWLDREVMKEIGIGADDIAQYLIDYRLRPNVPNMEELPEGYADELDEHLFSAAFPRSALGRIQRCTRAKGTG